MAGHSQFKNIMHRKGAQDIKRAKVFNKLAREITVAAKSGLADPAMNPRLRSAILAARSANMPRDRIERAVGQGAAGAGGPDYEAVRYEAYGPGGVALIIEALTDNRNRTAAELRSAFTKHGGALAETGAVAFMFARLGAIAYPAATASAEAMFEAALEAGAEDVVSGEEGHEVLTSMEDFAAVRDALEARFGPAESAALTWRAETETPLDDEKSESLVKLIDVLEDNDDVQAVSGNYALSDAVLERMSG